jgi:cation:H+ antiporter
MPPRCSTMFADLSLPVLLALIVLAAVVILVSGLRITPLADRLADQTGLGEAIIGGVLLGAATSVAGLAVTVTSALDGYPSLSFSNAVGGIAAQTAFLALADVVYRKANLEHAAAEIANVFQAGVLVVLLSIAILATTGPEGAVLGVHPASLILVIGYGAGVVLSRQVRQDPMWKPVETDATKLDTPDEDESSGRRLMLTLMVFGGLMLVMALAGWVLSRSASTLINRFDLSQSLVGALMTAVLTSLPELVTTLAAVRRGALQLAVGGIIGGNMFDTLFLFAADAAYRDGSIYHAVTPGDVFWLGTGLTMTAVLLLGLVLRQRNGPGRIGWESVTLLCLYAGAIAVQAMT